LNKEDYTVFGDVDVGADPAVPAEQGGKGFKGDGWETNTNFDLIGDPRAVKGGTIRTAIPDFPGTLRMGGPEWNTTTNYMIAALTYETLLTLHPTTLEFMPALATHWKVEPDKLTFRFRIDPNARFSDGAPVTADDVIASWKFYGDKTLEDPYNNAQAEKLEPPVAESKYIVKIKAKELGWQNFLVAANWLRVMPAHILKDITGASYLKDYNYKLVPGSGPYNVTEADIEKGKSVSIRRRNDYWASKYRANVGVYNFDVVKPIVVRDQNLMFEMFKKGDLDYYYVNRSKVWVEDLNFDKFQRGLLVKKKVFNNHPSNTQWMAFNTRRKPWDDIRVRKAFALLFNRELLIEKLFYKEYLPINSFYPGTSYENPDNPKNLYNPQEALKLLADAGWKDRDAQGRLMRDGKPLQIELLYSDKGSETWLTVYQEDLRKAGITMNLRLLTGETRFALMMKRQFDMVSGAWGAGSVFPDPKPEYHSSHDRPNTNNITGYHDKKTDELCEKYDMEFDPVKREAILKELDGVIMSQYHYIMEWYPPAERVAYWNRYGMPQGTFSRVGDYDGSLAPGIPQLWWIDPVKSQKLNQAMTDESVKLEISTVEDRYWKEFGKGQTSTPLQPKTNP